MKILTVCIPCYNSAAYMRKSIERALAGGEEVEILVVNDGSKDDTAKIADEYAAKYPTIIKAIHKENGGHGDAINAGLAVATGLYFKVVDSDDWFGKEPYQEVLKVIRGFCEENPENPELDVLISNYVYDKADEDKHTVIRYKHALKEGKLLNWDEDKIKFRRTQNVIMHAVTYKTQILRDCGLVLPKHRFYVDNLLLFKAMAYTKTVMYRNVDLYRYYIGRDDQSVNEKVMIGRIDQQIKVTEELIDYYSDFTDTHQISPLLDRFLIRYIDIMMCVSSVMCIIGDTKELLAKKKALWSYLKGRNKKLYKKMRHSIYGVIMNLPTKAGRKISKTSYHICQKIFKFN